MSGAGGINGKGPLRPQGTRPLRGAETTPLAPSQEPAPQRDPSRYQNHNDVTVQGQDPARSEAAQLSDAVARAKAAQQAQANDYQKEADDAYDEAAKTGVGGQAIQYWKDAQKHIAEDVTDGKTGVLAGTALTTGARVMQFFAEMSNVAEVEGSAAKLGSLSGSSQATAGDLAKASGMLALNVALAASNFIGIGGAAKGAARRAAAEKLIQEGEVLFGKAAVQGGIRGMMRATMETASTVAQDLKGIVSQLPDAGKLNPAEAETFLTGLKEFAAKYGIDFKFAKGAPEVTGDATHLSITTMGGKTDWHEYVHVVQMLQNRATALATQAERLGKPIAELTAAEANQAYKFMAETFEAQAYRHFEEGAVKATGFMSRGLNPETYKAVVSASLDSQATALAKGVMPDFHVGLGGRLYGDLTILGQSQAEIAYNLSPILSGINHLYRVQSDLR